MSVVYLAASSSPRSHFQLCERLPSPNGESAVACSSLPFMPSVSFTIGDRVFDLSPEQVIPRENFISLTAFFHSLTKCSVSFKCVLTLLTCYIQISEYWCPGSVRSQSRRGIRSSMH